MIVAKTNWCLIGCFLWTFVIFIVFYYYIDKMECKNWNGQNWKMKYIWKKPLDKHTDRGNKTEDPLTAVTAVEGD